MARANTLVAELYYSVPSYGGARVIISTRASLSVVGRGAIVLRPQRELPPGTYRIRGGDIRSYTPRKSGWRVLEFVRAMSVWLSGGICVGWVRLPTTLSPMPPADVAFVTWAIVEYPTGITYVASSYDMALWALGVMGEVAGRVYVTICPHVAYLTPKPPRASEYPSGGLAVVIPLYGVKGDVGIEPIPLEIEGSLSVLRVPKLNTVLELN